jgi:hypothetical protein
MARPPSCLSALSPRQLAAPSGVPQVRLRAPMSNEIERQIIARWLFARRCHMFRLLRARLEVIAYAPKEAR